MRCPREHLAKLRTFSDDEDGAWRAIRERAETGSNESP